MITTCWSVKGGSGATVVAASLGVLATRPKRSLSHLVRVGNPRSQDAALGPRVLLIDLAGDLPMMFGTSDKQVAKGVSLAEVRETGLGLSDWLFADEGVEPSSLERLIEPVGNDLYLLRLGQSSLFAGDHELDIARLVEGLEWLGSGFDQIIIDAGSASPELGLPCIEHADRSVLVIRPCYLSLRVAIESPLPAHAVVVVSTDGRSLDSHDVSAVLGVRDITTVPFDPEVARLVDSGLFGKRMPRSVEKLRQMAA